MEDHFKTDPERIAKAVAALIALIEQSPDPEGREARIDAFYGTAVSFGVSQDALEEAYSKHPQARPAYRRLQEPCDHCGAIHQPGTNSLCHV